MTQRTQQSKQYHDLHVPLASTSTYPPPSSSSSASNKRKQQAHMYQMRLHQLGHHGLAFTHTTYGRLNMERDDADVALPWKDLIPPSMMPASSRNSSTSSVNVEDDNHTSFGRTNSLGMKIYRRLNIIVEEVSDVSRILLPSAGSSSNKSAAAASSASSSSISNLFQKYDIISLQPMNEPALQNICELLSPAVTVDSTFVNSNKSDNNLTTMPQIDILVMEYATGSRGGYGLPYKMRKEYLTKALEAGITFELCYGTAMLDPKRRQGFLRTLVDFQGVFNSIQKKNMILNKHIHLHHNGNCKSEKFPLLLSSGPRQNYSQGTDEGVMALRSPIDVKCLVHHLVGGDGWLEKGGNNGDGVDADLFDENTIDGITRKSKKKIRYLMSAAEKVLSRARDRSLGVVTTRGSGFSGNGGELKKRKRGFPSGVDVRISVSDVRVQGTGSLANQEEGDDEDGHDFSGKSATSLVDWLSEPMQQISEPATITVEPPKSDSEDGLSAAKTNAKEIFARIKAKQIDKKVQGEKMDDSEDGGDDLEDGYIAL